MSVFAHADNLSHNLCVWAETELNRKTHKGQATIKRLPSYFGEVEYVMILINATGGLFQQILLERVWWRPRPNFSFTTSTSPCDGEVFWQTCWRRLVARMLHLLRWLLPHLLRPRVATFPWRVTAICLHHEGRGEGWRGLILDKDGEADR